MEAMSASRELWPPDPRRHIMPVLTMSQSRTRNGKHICQHPLCVLPRTMRKLTTHKLSSFTCPIPLEVSSTWACHYKSISLVRKIKHRFPHFALFKRLGCNKCGNQVCYQGALAPRILDNTSCLPPSCHRRVHSTASTCLSTHCAFFPIKCAS